MAMSTLAAAAATPRIALRAAAAAAAASSSSSSSATMSFVPLASSAAARAQHCRCCSSSSSSSAGGVQQEAQQAAASSSSSGSGRSRVLQPAATAALPPWRRRPAALLQQVCTSSVRGQLVRCYGEGGGGSSTAAAAAAAPPTAAATAAPHAAAAASAAPPKKKAPPPRVRQITKDDVEYTFARSGGAGGQNVNKVNTKVDMRFDLDAAGWVPDEVKEAVKRAERNRFTKEGVLVVTSTRHRTQAQNLDDCLQKLQAMLDAGVEAATPKEADPETVKRVKASIKAGHERRLDAKKRDGKKKAERRRRDFD